MAERRTILPERLSIGIDIGGTKVKAGVVDPDGRVVARLMRDTPTTQPDQVVEVVAEIVDELSQSFVAPTVGIGAAGFVDVTQSTVLFAPHLAWRNEPLREAVQRRIRRPVLVDNDANCAAWAEWQFGAAQNEGDMVCLTLGTGIGGALVLGQRLFRGRSGIAGEFGHMMVVPDGRACECGNRGCLEQYASGNALIRDAREAVEAQTPYGKRLLAAAEDRPERVNGSIVSTLAVAGDEEAQEALASVGAWLGVGLSNLAAAFDPGMFVIGGGVSDAGELLLEPARERFRQTLTGRGYRAEARIVRAHLGNDAGVVGAADMARVLRRRRRGRPGERRSLLLRRRRPDTF